MSRTCLAFGPVQRFDRSCKQIRLTKGGPHLGRPDGLEATEDLARRAVDECVSALQKAIRRGELEHACWWAAELDRSGHGALAWSRLETICSEDVGPALPHGPAVVEALRQQWDRAKKRRNANRPERLPLMHAVLLLAGAPKTRIVDHAAWASYGHDDRLFDVPDWALDMFTARGKRMGRGADHWETSSALLVNEADLPDPFVDGYLAADKAAWDRQGTVQGQQELPHDA
jgi:replication-associated recombination protein RarA